MRYASFDDFRDAIMPHLPGANPAAVESAFFLRAQDFYRTTRSWREVLGGFVVPDGQPLVVWLQPVDDKADIAYVEQVWWQEMNTPPILPNSAMNTLPWTVDGAQELRVSDSWVESGTFRDRLVYVQVSCQPTTRHGRILLPPHSLTHHRDTLVSGVLASLLGSPKKPYSDGNAALMHERRFQAGMVKWRGTQDRHYTPHSLRAAPRHVRMR
jgi:hypothetical protein